MLVSWQLAGSEVGGAAIVGVEVGGDRGDFDAGITADRIDAIGWNWNPMLASERAITKRSFVERQLVRASRRAFSSPGLRRFQGALAKGFFPEQIVSHVRAQLLYWLGIDETTPLFCFDHHLAHAASAYHVSGFDQATIVTWDCWGDHLSGMLARGRGDEIETLREIPYEQFSIGKLNDFVYEFLRTSEKGNLMGLAPYGKPAGMLDDLVDVDRMTMRMDLLNRTAPFPAEFLRVAGPPRRPGDPLEERHKHLAADLQAKIEALGMNVVRRAVDLAGSRNLCLAGGCALNATLNGKIGRSGLVDALFVQPNAGDAGGALGAALLAHKQVAGSLPRQTLEHAYWGPSFTTEEIVAQIDIVKVDYEVVEERDIPDLVSDLLVDQKIIGWFQLGSEWGPRALGARSIIADPRDEAIRDRVNAAVKYRDWWRPFAPSMLAEYADEYLEGSFHAPFMIVTFPVKPRHRAGLGAVIHVDGTTRPQMVVRDANPLYYDTIRAFAEKTGVPMVLNTSFNLKGEPMVNTPRDALRTFFSSGLDVLVMNNVVVRKPRSDADSSRVRAAARAKVEAK